MPNTINFVTDLGAVSIELLDTKFVDFWYKHFVAMSTQYELQPKPRAWPYFKAQDCQQVADIVDRIISTINKINQISYLQPLPETVDKQQLLALDLGTQQLLNRLHRYAVVGTEIRDRWEHHSNSLFDLVPFDDEQYMYLLNLLNQSIHALEEFVQTPHKLQFLKANKGIELCFSASKYNDVDVYQDGADLEIPAHMQECLQLTGYDVWIKKDLLGKDFITAFADHDDPLQFDIRPPPMVSGGIMIDYNNGLDDIFSSNEFRQWLGSAPTNYHGSYPLGKVISGKQHLKGCKSIKLSI
jgi:hypothetical protein